MNPNKKHVVTGLPPPLKGKLLSYEQFANSQRQPKKTGDDSSKQRCSEFVFYLVFSYGPSCQPQCSWQWEISASELLLHPTFPMVVSQTIVELFNGWFLPSFPTSLSDFNY
jgi:hypothetical protein